MNKKISFLLFSIFVIDFVFYAPYSYSFRHRRNRKRKRTSQEITQPKPTKILAQNNTNMVPSQEQTKKPSINARAAQSLQAVKEAEKVPKQKISPEVAASYQSSPPINLAARDLYHIDLSSFPDKPMRPKTATDDPDDTIEVNFEDANLENILDWISQVFDVSFITSDDLKPAPQGAQAGVANKRITFKTHKPLTRKKLWDLFVTFLDLWFLSITQSDADPTIYQVVSTNKNASPTINQSPLPAYIDVHWKRLPETNMRMRYIYFVKNANSTAMYNLVRNLMNPRASLIDFSPLNALIMTDKAFNIRSLMQIVEELDKNVSPEAMSVLKLKNADANDVAQLYNNLTKQEAKPFARFLGGKPAPTQMYFPQGTRVIAEPRANALIILGTRDGIKKVENFVINHIDTALKMPYSPLFVYDLQYAQADVIVNILNQVTKFAPGSDAANYGSVRGGDKYFQNMKFEAEKEGNRILIRAEKEDYLKVKDLIKTLDTRQPQVAIEVLIVSVSETELKELGVQMRNKKSDTLSKNVNFQNSGLLRGDSFSTPQVVPGPPPPNDSQTSGSIMADLITLASGQDVGSTLISIGNAATQGVWAIFKLLDRHAHTSILSNPFLIATNKYTATVSLGETKRIEASTVLSGGAEQNSFTDLSALLTVQITPQINSNGIINLDINFNQTAFQFPQSAVDATRNSEIIKTNVNVANGEVLAFGGLLRRRTEEKVAKVPGLGDIPILGWFFKNKFKQEQKSNILVFISPHIIDPRLEPGMDDYTQHKTDIAQCDLYGPDRVVEKRDPIHRWFFQDQCDENSLILDDFAKGVSHQACSQSKKADNPYLIEGKNQSCTSANNNTMNDNITADTISLAQVNKKQNESSLSSFMPAKKPDKPKGAAA